MNQETLAMWLEALADTLEPWELEALEDAALREDAFAGSLKFGTGGIRALMGVGPNRMNSLTISKAAQGVAAWLSATAQGASAVIAYDTRLHSRDFAVTTACVLAANGIAVKLFEEPQPTPVLDYATRALACAAGVCITASHNPREYNGFKVYGSDGVQATDAIARAIQAYIEGIDPFDHVKTLPYEEALEAGFIELVDETLLKAFQEAVLRERLGVSCAELKLVYSPLNGTGLVQTEALLQALGARYSLVEVQAAPDGNFPNCPKPNPENPSAMAMGMAQMAAEGADIFLATDPDADRVGVACMDGGEPRLLTGNEVGLLLFDWMCQHALQDKAQQVAVTTIVTAPLMDVIAQTHGIELRHTLTGFKYVGEQIGLIEDAGKAFLVGVEESDGYLRGSYVRDKDGICAIMLVCELAAYYKAQGQTLADALEQLYEHYGFLLGKQLVYEYPGEAGKSLMAALMSRLRQTPPSSVAGLSLEQLIDYAPGAPMSVVCGTSEQILPPSNVLEWRFKGGSRVLLRPSGTEPKLKIYVFTQAVTRCEAQELLADFCKEISSLVQVHHDDGSLA